MSALDNLISVARALAPIRGEHFVFAGASILPLLINDPAAPPPRSTIDVGVVVTVVSYGRWQNLQGRLRDCGFVVRADVPVGKARLCLFHLGNLEVDIMPVDIPEIGCPSRTLEIGLRYAEPYQVQDLVINALSAPGFLAAKLEAFEDRGVRDVHLSKDLEDITRLLDGRFGLAEEVLLAPPELRIVIATKMARLLVNNQALDVISDFLREPTREFRLLSLMQALSEMTG